MDPIVVFVDDVSHARSRVAERLAALPASSETQPWRVVLCTRPLRRHTARRLTREQRAAWRSEQAAALRDGLQPLWPAESAAAVEWVVADRPCTQLLKEWRRAAPGLQAIDLRRDGFDRLDGVASLDSGAPVRAQRSRWAAPLAATASLSALLVLAD